MSRLGSELEYHCLFKKKCRANIIVKEVQHNNKKMGERQKWQNFIKKGHNCGSSKGMFDEFKTKLKVEKIAIYTSRLVLYTNFLNTPPSMSTSYMNVSARFCIVLSTGDWTKQFIQRNKQQYANEDHT